MKTEWVLQCLVEFNLKRHHVVVVKTDKMYGDLFTGYFAA